MKLNHSFMLEAIFRNENTAYKLMTCLFAAIFIGFISQVKIPLPFTPVPITLQTLAIFLVVGMLKDLGVISVALYLLLGFSGFPFFAGGAGGFFSLFSPTTGYLLGFLLAAYLAYLSYEKFHKNFIKLVVVWFLIDLVVIHGLGIFWLGWFLKIYDFKKLIFLGSLPFILGDLVKILIVVWILRILSR